MSEQRVSTLNSAQLAQASAPMHCTLTLAQASVPMHCTLTLCSLITCTLSSVSPLYLINWAPDVRSSCYVPHSWRPCWQSCSSSRTSQACQTRIKWTVSFIPGVASAAAGTACGRRSCQTSRA